MDYTKDVNSPEIFRLWSAITAMAAAMERRCWTQTKQGLLYPNLFTMLVSSPGIGKTEAIKRAEEILTYSDKISVTPQSMTRASLIDTLKASTHVMLDRNGKTTDYHSLALVVDELGTMISAHDLEFLSVLNKLFDCPHVHRERRRHFNEGKEIIISQPQLNILAGSQPAFLAHLLPEEAWGMGFTSRMLLIYAGQPAEAQDVFGESEDLADVGEALAMAYQFKAEANGPFQWTPEAKRIFNAWKAKKCEPIPEHSKLVHYLPRRHIYAIKLAMVSSLSRGLDLEVLEDDMTRGLDWLLAAEQVMPDIFREMAGKSDSDTLMELHYYMWQTMTQRKAKGKPGNVTEGEMYNFLRNRIPGEKIGRIIEVADRAKIIVRDVTDPSKWKATPKNLHGIGE